MWSVSTWRWLPVPCLQAEEAAETGGVQAQIYGKGAGGVGRSAVKSAKIGKVSQQWWTLVCTPLQTVTAE